MLIYILSRLWKDLLFVHLIRLQPLPFCGPNRPGNSSRSNGTQSDSRGLLDIAPGSPVPCAPAAPAATQALVAMLLLVVAPFLVRLRRVRTSSSMTTLIGMCLGWGMGDALVQLHVELVDALVGEPTATGVRNVLNICLSSLSTLAAAILILGLDRIAHRLRARSALRLPSQALGVSCMVGWAHTARALITSGLTDTSLTPALRHGLYARVLVLWALCLSTPLRCW